MTFNEFSDKSEATKQSVRKFDSIDQMLNNPEAIVWFYIGHDFYRRRFPASLIPVLLEQGIIGEVVLRWEGGVPRSVKANAKAYTIYKPAELEKALLPYL